MSSASAPDPRKTSAALDPVYPILNLTAAGAGAAEVRRVESLARAVAGVGITTIQLRAKSVSSGGFHRLALSLVALTADLSCRLIVNDRIDVTLAARGAGVHLGDEDLDPAVARRLLGPDAIIGYSTHSPAEARAASALPVDYVGFGPVFDSPTKPGAREPRGLSALAEACRVCVHPVVAIGGLTLERARQAWAAGAASVAVISDLERSPDPAALLLKYRQAAGRAAGSGR